jgi:thiol-disulfide isomerase/thioredoxin
MGDFKDSSIRFLTCADFEDEEPWKLKEPQCAIVLFYADWCGHCNNLKPVYAKFSDAAQFIEIAAVDTDANKALMEKISDKLNITGFPTLIKYSNGEPVGELEARDYAGLMKGAMELCNTGCRCSA